MTWFVSVAFESDFSLSLSFSCMSVFWPWQLGYILAQRRVAAGLVIEHSIHLGWLGVAIIRYRRCFPRLKPRDVWNPAYSKKQLENIHSMPKGRCSVRSTSMEETKVHKMASCKLCKSSRGGMCPLLILVGTEVILVNSGSLGSDTPIAVKYIVHT